MVRRATRTGRQQDPFAYSTRLRTKSYDMQAVLTFEVVECCASPAAVKQTLISHANQVLRERSLRSIWLSLGS